MHKVYGHIAGCRLWEILVSLVWMLFVAGCSQPARDASVPEGPGVTVTMNIATEKSDTYAESPEVGESIHTLWVYAYRGNVQIGSYRVPDVASAYPDGTIRFLMDLELPSYSDPCDVTFYVVANEDTFRNGTTSGKPSGSSFFRSEMSRSALDAYTFERIYSGTSTSPVLPLTLRTTRTLDPSRVTVNTAAGHEEHYLLTDPLEFSLERSVGRVDLYFTRESGGPADYTLDIHSVTMSPEGLCDYGYAFPVTDAGLLASIPHTTTSPYYVVGSEGGSPIRVTAMTERGNHDLYEDLTAGRRYYCYENPFGSTDANTAGDGLGYELRVTYSIDGDGKSEKSIYLPPTDRNTLYRVWCCVPYDGLIYVDYVVEDWIDTEEVDLTFDYPEYEFKPYVDGDTNTETHYAGDGSTAGSVRFSFMMRKGISWTPSLLGDAGGYRINVYPENQPSEWNGAAISPSETWYTIEITPVHGLESYWDTATGTVKSPVAYLTITSQLWNRPSMRLEINPQGRFPSDDEFGTDYTSYIKITQGENM